MAFKVHLRMTDRVCVCVHSEWMPGQPDDWRLHGLGGGEDCAHFHRDGRYNDDHCTRKYRFVCKSHVYTM